MHTRIGLPLGRVQMHAPIGLANAYTYQTFWEGCKCIRVLDFLGGVQMHTRIRLSGRGANAYTY